MKDFILVLEYVLTELNGGIYFNPIGYTEEQKKEKIKESRKNMSIDPFCNITAQFTGVETFNYNQVLCFKSGDFSFKLTPEDLIYRFKKLLSILDIKESELKKEEKDLSESELKLVSKLSKFTDKKSCRPFYQCVHFLSNNIAFVTNNYYFVSIPIESGRKEMMSYNPHEKAVCKENMQIKESSIENVLRYERKNRITFDTDYLKSVVKMELKKGFDKIVINDHCFNTEFLSKLLSFIPKKQKSISIFIPNDERARFVIELESGGILAIMKNYEPIEEGTLHIYADIEEVHELNEESDNNSDSNNNNESVAEISDPNDTNNNVSEIKETPDYESDSVSDSDPDPDKSIKTLSGELTCKTNDFNAPNHSGNTNYHTSYLSAKNSKQQPKYSYLSFTDCLPELIQNKGSTVYLNI